MVSMPVWCQERLYPVPVNGGLGAMHIQSTPSQPGHSRFLAEKPQYELRLGFPTDVEGGYLPDTGAKILVLWLRIENLTKQSMSFDVTRFTAIDDEGRMYSMLSPDLAFDRLIAANGLSRSVLAKAARGISLGRLANKGSEEDLRDETKRFSLQSGQVPAQGMKEGLIFFEAPLQKNFTINIGLGDLWSKPFTFTNLKPKK
jgi:hypothetical protein